MQQCSLRNTFPRPRVIPIYEISATLQPPTIYSQPRLSSLPGNSVLAMKRKLRLASFLMHLQLAICRSSTLIKRDLPIKEMLKMECASWEKCYFPKRASDKFLWKYKKVVHKKISKYNKQRNKLARRSPRKVCR